MKDNYETCIVGSKCILVPYRRVHVEKYHAWMQDPALLQATGSEPLSLKEEYEMQESWRTDEKKCTFIVLQCNRLERQPPNQGDGDDKFVVKNVSAMVGDVNLFLSEEDVDEEKPSEDNEKDPQQEKQKSSTMQAEMDIMIAEESARGQGIGLEASCLMMLYGAKKLGIRRFFCKINEDNQSSLSLFRKLKFKECDYAACFQQYEYELKRSSPEDIVGAIAPFMSSTQLHCVHCSSDETKELDTTSTS